MIPGKVYLIHRDFPLPMHAHSQVAAQYSRAAAQIGKFEVVEQALFQNQERWEQTGDVDGTVAAALSPAEMTKVRVLVKGGTLNAAIQKDVALGKFYNVNQTPTTVFHAKGQTFPYAGVMSYEILRNFLFGLRCRVGSLSTSHSDRRNTWRVSVTPINIGASA